MDLESYKRTLKRIYMQDFYAHLVVYGVVNFVFVVVNLVAYPSYLWSIWIVILWGILLLIHALSVFTISDKYIQEEWKEHEENIPIISRLNNIFNLKKISLFIIMVSHILVGFSQLMGNPVPQQQMPPVVAVEQTYSGKVKEVSFEQVVDFLGMLAAIAELIKFFKKLFDDKREPTKQDIEEGIKEGIKEGAKAACERETIVELTQIININPPCLESMNRIEKQFNELKKITINKEQKIVIMKESKKTICMFLDEIIKRNNGKLPHDSCLQNIWLTFNCKQSNLRAA